MSDERLDDMESRLRHLERHMVAMLAPAPTPEPEPHLGLPMAELAPGSAWALELFEALQDLAEYPALHDAVRAVAGYRQGSVTADDLGVVLADLADPFMAVSKALVQFYSQPRETP
jgi:hypothetical protein